MENIEDKISALRKALYNSWSIDTSTKWTKQNPANGQCGVTALVVNDILSGEIVKTKVQKSWHFYNIINGKRYDFTASQFQSPIKYHDIPSNRIEAYFDTNESQYSLLKQSVIKRLQHRKSK